MVCIPNRHWIWKDPKFFSVIYGQKTEANFVLSEVRETVSFFLLFILMIFWKLLW